MYNPKKRTILIAGCRSIGCLAGAKYMAELFNDKNSMIKKIYNYDEYALVLKVFSHSLNDVGVPELIEVHKIWYYKNISL